MRLHPGFATDWPQVRFDYSVHDADGLRFRSWRICRGHTEGSSNDGVSGLRDDDACDDDDDDDGDDDDDDDDDDLSSYITDVPESLRCKQKPPSYPILGKENRSIEQMGIDSDRW